jgi:hypothetical protein
MRGRCTAGEPSIHTIDRHALGEARSTRRAIPKAGLFRRGIKSALNRQRAGKRASVENSIAKRLT